MVKNIIDIVIQECLTIGPSDNWNYKEKILNQYGNSAWIKVEKILDSLKTINPNWEKETYATFLVRVANTIKDEYPHLDEKSVHVLMNRVAYTYK